MFFDKVEQRMKFKWLKKMITPDPRVIYEVGAHYGEDTMRMAKTWPNAEIVGFEPDPRNIEVIKRLLPVNELTNLPTFFEIALADKKGTMTLYQSFDPKPLSPDSLRKYGWIPPEVHEDLQLHRSGSSSLQPSNENLLGTVRVDVSTLDEFTKKKVSIDLLWIDVQGAERRVLDGGKDTLKQTRYLWIEYGETVIYEGAMSFHETKATLEERGFNVIYADSTPQGDLLAKNRRL